MDIATLYDLCVLALIVLAVGLLFAVHRTLTLLDRERQAHARTRRAHTFRITPQQPQPAQVPVRFDLPDPLSTTRELPRSHRATTLDRWMNGAGGVT